MRAFNRRQLLAAPLLGSARAEAGPLVLVPDDVLLDAKSYLDGRDPLRLTRFDGPHARRDVIELVMLHHALRRSALPLQGVPSVGRLLIELRNARGVVSGTSHHVGDIPARDPLLQPSLALVQEGEAEAGLYSTAATLERLQVRTAADLAQLTAVSCRDWRSDWQALQALGLRELLHVSNWPQMVRMVAAGRVHFLLAPFQARADLALHAEGLRLLPLPGLKLGLPGSRHLVLSTQHAAYAGLRAELDAGIARLRDSGLLRRAYSECGFFNHRVAGWQRL